MKKRQTMFGINVNLNELVSYCAQLEANIGRYVFEAHVQSLEGIDICEHDAGVCFCSYHASLSTLLELLEKSPIKNGAGDGVGAFYGAIDKIGNDFVWTQKLKVMASKVTETTQRYEHLIEYVRELILSEELTNLRSNGKTYWCDKSRFEELIERISAHIVFNGDPLNP
jgi:hypothetical protein